MVWSLMEGSGDENGGSDGVITLRGLTMTRFGANDYDFYHDVHVHCGGLAVIVATKGVGILVCNRSTRVAVINTTVHHYPWGGVEIGDGGTVNMRLLF